MTFEFSGPQQGMETTDGTDFPARETRNPVDECA